jgi:S-adenosylmethionine hydrolase
MNIVTLTSDIGKQDYLTGAIKGQLLRYRTDLNIIDISHSLSAFNYPQAAYVARHAIRNFPIGTFHLILVNIFDEKIHHMLLAEHNGHFIGCPDNGLITMILEEMPQKVVALPIDKLAPKNTLFYTNAFAKAISELISGKTIEEVGDVQVDIEVKKPLSPMVGDNFIEGQIILIDKFDNVVVNINKVDFEAHRKGRKFSIIFRRDEVIEKLSESYADVPEGEKLAFFNSAGYLEIAVNKGHAAGLFGLQKFSEKQYKTAQQQFQNSRIFYHTVKVFFE